MDIEQNNLTAREYLEQKLGPQHILLPIVIPITVIYIIIFVTGVIGNVAVCLVITRNSHFQTPTNYYLFSLAISDLLILVFGLQRCQPSATKVPRRCRGRMYFRRSRIFVVLVVSVKLASWYFCFCMVVALRSHRNT